MIFLAGILCLCVFALLVPSEEKQVRTLVAIAFAIMCLWGVISQLSRIEGKLDAILEKLNGK